jgi:hypothetical protein
MMLRTIITSLMANIEIVTEQHPLPHVCGQTCIPIISENINVEEYSPVNLIFE